MDRVVKLLMSEMGNCLADLADMNEMQSGGGAQENRAALDLISRMCPRGRQGIWYMADDASSEALASSGAVAVPNRPSIPADAPDFVPNRTNEWGDPIFAPNPAASVGLSHFIPVYATTSRLCHTDQCPIV